MKMAEFLSLESVLIHLKYVVAMHLNFKLREEHQ